MKAKKYIDVHWVEPLSIRELAHHVNLSESRLRNLFRTETGFSIHEYYGDVKMHHLCNLLTHPDHSISEVFDLCGITYNSYYLKLFKNYTGTTPRRFRSSKAIHFK